MDWHLKIWFKNDEYNSLVKIYKSEFIEFLKFDVLEKIYINYIITTSLTEQELIKITEDFFVDKLLEDYEISSFENFSIPSKLNINNAYIFHIVFRKEVLNPNDQIILRALNSVYGNKFEDLRSFYSYVFSKKSSKEKLVDAASRLISNKLLHEIVIEER